MGRGFIQGIVWGVLFGVVVAAVVSLMSPPPTRGIVPAGPIAAPSVPPELTPGTTPAGPAAPAPVPTPAPTEAALPAADTPQATADGATPTPTPAPAPEPSPAPAEEPRLAPPSATGTEAPAAAPAPGQEPAATPPAEATAPAAPGAAGTPPDTGAEAAIAPVDVPEGPAALRPQPGFSGEVPGVRTDRLPRIGDAPAPTPQPETRSAALTDPAGLPALDRFATVFANPEGKPLFSLILIDEDQGNNGQHRTALSQVAFPVTFAIDPMRPDAAEAAAAYRKAGHEVVLLATGLPEGATPSDLETAFQSHFRAVPEAVAVLDLPQGGFQSDGRRATQVAAIMAEDGRGIVTYARGLNQGSHVAGRAGVPDAQVFRVIDGEEENAETIRRALDRAAFKAVQEGAVVVVGHTRPETVAGLLAWTLEGRARDVALAPVSAVLKQD